MADLKAEEDQTVEGIKRIREDGTELWHARELALELDYAKWENFSKVTHRAILACRNSGFEAAEHFPEVRKGASDKKAKMKVPALHHLVFEGFAGSEDRNLFRGNLDDLFGVLGVAPLSCSSFPNFKCSESHELHFLSL